MEFENLGLFKVYVNYGWRFLSFKLCCLRLVEVVEEDSIVGLVDFEEVEVWKIYKV